MGSHRGKTPLLWLRPGRYVAGRRGGRRRAEVGTEVFAARRRLFGPDDIGTLGTAWNLAAILRQTGRMKGAIELLADTYDRARRICRSFRPLEMAVDR